MAAMTVSLAMSISSSVLNRPMPNRKVACAKADGRPIARKTYEGSGIAEVHDAPEDTASRV